MEQPLVSIVITAYNYGRYLAAAIDSALAQAHAPLEVLVLDNASTDETPDVVARYAHDPRVRAIRNETNIGMTPNHEQGLALARGAYISFLSADDVLLPNFVARALRFYRDHPDIDVLYGGAYFMNDEARLVRPREWPGQPAAAYAGGRNELAHLLAEGAYMCLQTMLVPRAIYERLGGWDPELISIDWEIVVRWAAAGVRFAFDPEPVARIRLHGEQTSGFSKHAASGREMRDYVAIFERHLDAAAPQRFAGHEPALRRVIENRDAFVRTTFGEAAAAEFTAPNARLRARVDTIAAANRTRPRTRIAYVVVADQSIGAFQGTLESLVAQPSGDWRAVVVQDFGVSYEPLCAAADPERIRYVRLPEPRALHVALQTALAIEDADIYIVLRCGAQVRPEHAAAVRAAFVDPTTLLAVCRPRFVIGQEELTLAPLDGADVFVFPPLAIEGLAFSRIAYDTYGFREVPFPEWDFVIRLACESPPRSFAGDVVTEIRPGMRHAGVAAPGALAALEQTYRTFPVTELGLLAARAAFLTRFREAHRQELRAVAGLRAFYEMLG